MNNALPDDIQDRIRERYRKRYKRYGYSEQSLGWTKNKQFIRFYALTRDFQMQNASLLDIGCGFGDINRYLARVFSGEYDYHGIDIVPEFIDEAKEIYADNNRLSFQTGNFLDMEFEKTFDYVVSCGIFNHENYGIDMYAFIEQTMKKAFSLCNISVAMDFLSQYVNYKNEDNFYSNPGKILEIAYGLSRNVVLRNDYFPFEFCVIIHKDNSFDPRRTFFNTFKNKNREKFDNGLFDF